MIETILAETIVSEVLRQKTNVRDITLAEILLKKNTEINDSDGDSSDTNCSNCMTNILHMSET